MGAVMQLWSVGKSIRYSEVRRNQAIRLAKGFRSGTDQKGGSRIVQNEYNRLRKGLNRN
jgi:hypothetical protein